MGFRQKKRFARSPGECFDISGPQNQDASRQSVLRSELEFQWKRIRLGFVDYQFPAPKREGPWIRHCRHWEKRWRGESVFSNWLRRCRTGVGGTWGGLHIIVSRKHLAAGRDQAGGRETLRLDRPIIQTNTKHNPNRDMQTEENSRIFDTDTTECPNSRTPANHDPIIRDFAET